MNKLIPLIVLTACSQSHELRLTECQPETDALLQAVSIVDENTVWLSGHKATFVRTQDGGDTWDVFSHASDTLQFRDVHAFDKDNIVLMSAGPGDQSRIFEVRNGVEWQERFVMQDSLGFLDCLDFWDDLRGIAYGDAIDAYPYILLTTNGGKSWSRADTINMPKAGKGEGGFAASGTCVTTGSDGLAWIATGAGGNARILKTENYGRSWQTHETPIIKGDFAGHTSIDFVNDRTGFITGGDLVISDEYTDNCAFSYDGGKTWALTEKPVSKGAFYGGSSLTLDDQNHTFICGPNGLDYTSDLGRSWSQLDSANLWAVDFHQSGVGWAVGRDAKVVKIEL